MSTSKTYQQSLTDAGFETRLQRIYKVMRYCTIYEMDLHESDSLSIPNEIYNYVDACTTTKEMWKRVELDSFDDLFDYLPQFRENWLMHHGQEVEKSHDPLAHNDVQTNSEDPLTYAMLLLARAITQNFYNPTNNRLRTSSNIRNQAIIQGDRVNIKSRNYGNIGRNTRRAYVQEDVIEGSNAQNETENDEAGVILTDEQNDFLFADASRMEEIEELSANICLMARIQPADNTSDAGPSYDSAFISELELYKERVWVLENIKGDNNYLNEFLEADRQAKHFNQQAQSQFVRDRDIIQDLEKQRDKLDLAVTDYKRKNEELQKTHLILKRQMSENEDRYHDTILDLEAKLKKNVDLILKLGNSLQGMFMLGPNILYLASSLSNSEIPLNVRDTEDTLDDASKSQQKMKEKNK
ncbi:hypothetical protein Tco_0271861 [Tanacetum coccineum]